MTYNIPSSCQNDSDIYIAIEAMDLPAVYSKGEYWQAELGEDGQAVGLWLVGHDPDECLFFRIESYNGNTVTLSA